MFVLPLSRVPARVQLNRVLDDNFDRFLSNALPQPSTRSPAVDVSETDTVYMVSFELPGATREQLKVSIEGRKVSLESVELAANDVPTGVTPETPAAESPRVLYRERSKVRFARTLSLPSEVDQAHSQAKYDNGVLTLTLSKKVKASATQLPIA